MYAKSVGTHMRIILLLHCSIQNSWLTISNCSPCSQLPSTCWNYGNFYCCCLVAKLCPTLLQPHGLQPTRLFCLWDFPDKNTEAGCHFLFQGNFPTQGWNPSLLNWQTGSLPLSHQGRSPMRPLNTFKNNKRGKSMKKHRKITAKLSVASRRDLEQNNNEHINYVCPYSYFQECWVVSSKKKNRPYILRLRLYMGIQCFLGSDHSIWQFWTKKASGQSYGFGVGLPEHFCNLDFAGMHYVI